MDIHSYLTDEITICVIIMMVNKCERHELWNTPGSNGGSIMAFYLYERYI